MNERIKRMMQEIEEAGGVIHLSPLMPDNVAEAFLNEILTCPDCAAAMKINRKYGSPTDPPIDRVLADGEKNGRPSRSVRVITPSDDVRLPRVR